MFFVVGGNGWELVDLVGGQNQPIEKKPLPMGG